SPTARAPSAIFPRSLHAALPISARSGCLRFRDSLVPDAPSSLPGQASAWFTSLRVRCANFALKCPPFPAENPAKSGTASGLRGRSEEHTSELQSRENLVCRLLLE